jgi:hypothetical protein
MGLLCAHFKAGDSRSEAARAAVLWLDIVAINQHPCGSHGHSCVAVALL